MSEPGSGAGLQPDMHLKPLDNSALLKPLRKAPAMPDAMISPAPAPAAAPAPPPPAPEPVIEADDDKDPLIPAADTAPAPAAKVSTEEEILSGISTADTDTPEPPVPAAPEPEAAQPAPDRPAPEPAAEEPAMPEPAPAPQAIPESTPAAEPAPAPTGASFQPTDQQMHMMELMKTIFSSALNSSLQTDTPPQPGDTAPTPEVPAAPAAAPAPPAEPSLGDLRKQLIALQQKIREAGIPVVIIIEGLSASGKGAMLTKLIGGLDARGYDTHPVRKPNCVEKQYPPMWRYWTKMPKRGDIALFCSSWYGELNKTCVAKGDDAVHLMPARVEEIISMESQLICDGTLILKFFLHISQQEQFDRLRRIAEKKKAAWRVDEHDHEQNKRFDEYMKGMDNLMSITNLKGAAWHILDATDLKACATLLFQSVIQAFEGALAQRKGGVTPWDVPMLPGLSTIPSQGIAPLSSIDLNKHLEDSYKSEVKRLQKKLQKLQVKLYRKGIPMVVAFEGWDAAGKGGAIRRLNAGMDARGFTVAPISAPTPLEAAHHYLWRFFKELPPKGHITVFDRTWYGRVMVERVEGLCTQPQWQRAFEEINRFEKLLTDDGAVLCKFWLQIDPATQLERFQARQADPEKQWKLTDEDWRNRDKWPAYEHALNEVLQRTHTAHAPWTVVEANDKEYARVKVLRTVIDAIESRLGGGKKDD